MKKTIVLTTSEIQNSMKTEGAKIPLRDGTCLYSQGALEWALAQKNLDPTVHTVVVTTRTRPTDSDDWWISLVDEVFWCASEKAVDPGFGWREFFAAHRLTWPHEPFPPHEPVFWTTAQSWLKEFPVQGDTHFLFPPKEAFFKKIWG
jgi:hypothetical protein